MRHRLRSARGLHILLALLLALSTLGACTKPPDVSKPALNLPVADDTVAALVQALAKMDVTNAPLASSPTAAQSEVAAINAGMDKLLPDVTPGPITYAKDQPTATVGLHFAWPLFAGAWEYDTTANLENNGQGWKVSWNAALIHPKLNIYTRLVHTRTQAKRAGMVGNNGEAIVEERTIVRVGIDKTQLTADKLDAAASALAAVVGVDPNVYTAQVKAAGARAFVVAITMRQADVPAAVASIAGAVGLEAKAMLGPTPSFAADLLGGTGEATPEIIANSGGKVAAGDTVGVTGLQKRYDDQLRGVAGQRISLVARKPGTASTTPAASSSAPPASPSAGASSAPAPTPSAVPTVTTTVLFNVDPVPGKTVALSLDYGLQTKAEAVLAGVPGPAAMAVIRPSTGAILAAANSPATGGQSEATFGRWAPGSTFKIATSLALFRQGLTPESMVNCTATTSVNNWPFKNYADFPSSRVGRISLQDAVAASCNTAFINEHDRVSGDNLRDAAASLGLGIDHDAGFPVNYGIVPKPDSETKKASEFIGQGGVLASPVAMAGMTASVAAGHTVLPWLVVMNQPVSTASPLSPTEAGQLQQIMTRVVQAGSGRVLQSVAVGAKTGTAEYGTGSPLPTHAWMIAYTGNDLAIAVWVKDGASGSGTAAPLITALLT